MKKFACLLLALYTSLSLFAQQGAVGEWQPYLSYYNTTQIAEGNNHVFGVAGGTIENGEIDGSLYSLNKVDLSVVYYSKMTGLSDNQISQIGYNPEVNTLLIAYRSSGNIDLMGEDGIYNLPYLKNNTNIQDKTINEIFFYKEYAYLSTNFGILLVNLRKKEITDTYKLNQPVYSVCIKGGYLYASISGGIIKGKLSDNLLDRNVWQPHPLNTDVIKSTDKCPLAVFQDQLCFLVKQKGVYYQQADGNVRSLLLDGGIQGMKGGNNKLLSYTTNRVFISTSLTAYETIATGSVNTAIPSLKNADTYWIAAGTDGIRGFRKNGGKYETIFSSIQANEPKRNIAAFMTTNGSKLLIAGGGRWTDRNNRPGTLMTYEDNTWFNLNEADLNKKANVTCKDYMGIAVDPRDPAHYFVATYGEGIIELKDNEFVKLYNHTNSTLTTIIASDPYHYVRVGSVTFDTKNNLWAVNNKAKNVINVMQADGTWTSLYYSDIANEEMIDKILITSGGTKWVNIPYPTDRTGLFIFDDKGTIADTSDDQYKLYRSLVNSKGENLNVSGFSCMAEDKNGQIWIGTNKGPIICPQPNRALEQDGNNMYCNRIIHIQDDGTPFYFLDDEKITAIAIDGGNRKWIGTEGSGIFLISEDGMETIQSFTAENSPLLSNSIQSIAINPQTGEVFIGTDKGIISYMGEATVGSESYSEVYAYPNPVRPEYDDRVTVTGLMEESNVKITDVSGNILYQGKSAGGQLTWNCRNRKGERVASGVYLVLSSTPEAKESVVTKIMVMR